MDKAPLDMSTEELEDYVAVIGLNDDMYFSLHSSAQSELAVLHGLCEDRFNELAALREELAKVTEMGGMAVNRAGVLARDNEALQQRLTAAEQRNAELEKSADLSAIPAIARALKEREEAIELLLQNVRHFRGGTRHAIEATTQKFLDSLPTESGASE